MLRWVSRGRPEHASEARTDKQKQVQGREHNWKAPKHSGHSLPQLHRYIPRRGDFRFARPESTRSTAPVSGRTTLSVKPDAPRSSPKRVTTGVAARSTSGNLADASTASTAGSAPPSSTAAGRGLLVGCAPSVATESKGTGTPIIAGCVGSGKRKKREAG